MRTFNWHWPGFYAKYGCRQRATAPPARPAAFSMLHINFFYRHVQPLWFKSFLAGGPLGLEINCGSTWMRLAPGLDGPTKIWLHLHPAIQFPPQCFFPASKFFHRRNMWGTDYLGTEDQCIAQSFPAARNEPSTLPVSPTLPNSPKTAVAAGTFSSAAAKTFLW